LKVYESFVPSIEEEYKEPSFNLYEISFLINRVYEVSQVQIELYGYGFFQLLRDTQLMSKYWNSVVEPIQKKLRVDFNNRAVLEAKKNQVGPKLITGK